MTTKVARGIRWWPGAAFVLLGGLGVTVSFTLASNTRSFLSAAMRADGVVVSANAGSNHPVIEFALPNGEKNTFATGGFISGYKVGRRVQVLYLAESPQTTVTLDDPGALWFPTRVAGGMGAGLMVVGLLAMFVRSKTS